MIDPSRLSLAHSPGHVCHIAATDEIELSTRCEGLLHIDAMRKKWPQAIFYLERLDSKAFITAGEYAFFKRALDVRRFLAAVNHPCGHIAFAAPNFRETMVARWYCDGYHLAIVIAIESTGDQSGRSVPKRIADRATASAGFSATFDPNVFRDVACRYKPRLKVS
jgi:hypothetical protein